MRAVQLFGEFAADSLQIAQTDKRRTTACCNPQAARSFAQAIAGVTTADAAPL